MIVKILDLQKEKYHHKIMTKKSFNKLDYGDIILLILSILLTMHNLLNPYKTISP